jgi:hypothetical protein
MNLGDVFAVLALLIGLGIALPGLLLAWSLLLPGTVARAQTRLRITPGRCMALGAIWLVTGLAPAAALMGTRAGPAQFLGWLIIAALLTLASLGAAGMAALMGERLRGGGAAASVHGGLVRGAITLELAGVFPIIGWFIAIPLITITSLGAGLFALLRWAPHMAPAPAAAIITPEASRVAQPS